MYGGNKNEEIFTKICDIMGDSQFKATHSDFFLANASKFLDEEENKHEWYTIHKDYMGIVEQILESKLRETYSSDEIDDFYKTFNDKKAKYEEMDPETYDDLYQFIDFEHFKKVILEFKEKHKTALLEAAKPAEMKAEEMAKAGEEHSKDAWKQF